MDRYKTGWSGRELSARERAARRWLLGRVGRLGLIALAIASFVVGIAMLRQLYVDGG